MKKSFQLSIILLLSILYSTSKCFSSNELFRTKTSGNWNSTSTWEMSTDGGNSWIAATNTPVESSGEIIIRNPDVVTVTANISANQLSINSAAGISINPGITLRITDDTGNDLTIEYGGSILGAQGSELRFRGSSLLNDGIISPGGFYLDTVSVLAGSGVYTGESLIIGSAGNVILESDIAFSNVFGFSINSGGVLNPNNYTFIFDSGILTLYPGSSIINSGIFQTQGTVYLEIKDGADFNAPLNTKNGSTVAYNFGTPFTAEFNNTVTIDSGSTFGTFNGGFTVHTFNNVVNNGTISGGNGASFRFNGNVFTNNGIVTIDNFIFSQGARTLQGTGYFGTTLNVTSGVSLSLGSNHKLKDVVIYNGGIFSLSNFKLSLSGINPIVNNGNLISSNNTIEYNGTSTQNISTVNVNYNKLVINNPAGTTLTGNENVNDSLFVIQGDLNLNGFVLSLSSAGYLAETPGNTVNGSAGYITATRNLNSPSSINVAGLGAVITSASNLGTTEIRRGCTIQTGLNGNSSIERYFDIFPTNNSGLNATFVFKYDQSELNGKAESTLSLFRSTNSGATWTSIGGNVNTSTNSITLGSVNSFSRWSASGSNVIASQIKLIMEGLYNPSLSRMRMRDTVRAYFRNNFSPYSIADSAKSVIDSLTFSGNFSFLTATSGVYYIQLKHRNSIETWSKFNGQSYNSGSSFTYDFTTSSSQAFGNNMIQKGSKFCLYSGDVNQDGVIDGLDLIIVENSLFNFKTGYLPEDCNGDNVVDGSDALIVDNNAFNFVSKIVP